MFISGPKTVSIHQLHEINTSKRLPLPHWILWRTIIFGQIMSVCLCIPSNYHTPFMHKCSITYTHWPKLLAVHNKIMCFMFTPFLACRRGDKGSIPVEKFRKHCFM